MPDVSIMPEPFRIGAVNVGQSVIIAWLIIAVLIILMLIARIKIRKFSGAPKGFQAFCELIVGGMRDFAKGQLGEAHVPERSAADIAAPAVFTLMVYVFATTIVELFGLPPATDDINCTLALGLCAFITVNVTAIRVRGIKGRAKAWTRPVTGVAPIRILTDCITPFSMAIRLFANVLAGGVIMKLLYAVVPVLIPAALGAYFNVLHVGIQTFVFGLLPLMYIGEAVE
ncbi:MAG: F0F1 ATP synthase subunit A [Oscillospiraceae bacterium]|nr:F0F1 ATP synthase subunit A [Oscillospiraceae bacterium]